LKHCIRLFGVLLATVFLTACLNSTTIVKVKPDGSGTVEQLTLVNTAALKSMMPGAAKQDGGPVINKADLERTAARMGKGVRLLSAEKATGENGFEGTRAIFAFDDINEIQVSQEPSMSGSTSGRLSSEPTADDPVKFHAQPVNPAGKGDMPDITNPMVMNMLKTMFQGFKINIGLEVEGSIVKTNAEYVSGPRITLLEMDMASLLADEAKLKALQSKIGPSVSLTEVRPYLKDIKGIKIDGPSISVEFR
jgi:hypothetical protein